MKTGRVGAVAIGGLFALFLLFLVPAASAADESEVRDEAARPCPAGVDPSDPTQSWWCGYDPANIVAVEDGQARLTAFAEHRYVSIAAVPTTDSRNLDWTCIDGACGGLLDRGFIVNRELSHIWRPRAPGDPLLEITDKQWERAVRGRNTWLLWSGGNHAFWDYLARRGYGLADFLKLLDNQQIPRADRFRQLGLINEPGMTAPDGPGRFGLALDVPVGWDGDWPPPLGTPLPREVPDPYVYGYSSGVLGMRLFPNPAFFYGEGAEEAQRAWDPDRFMSDQNYAKDPNLLRPYRVGVSCGFCHVTFNPINPPADTAEPKWENISSTIGGQHLKFGRLAAFDFKQTNFLWHLINYAKPGTVDTSLVATDGINNPNIINGMFNLVARVANGFHFTETASPETQAQPVLDLSVLGLGLPELPAGPERNVMRILAGGEDSVGGRLALARVYLNIGVFHDYWRRTANLLVGIREQSPFRFDVLRANSVYWNVGLYRSQNMAEYLAYASGPLNLADAPGGAAYLAGDAGQIERGREHFATHCLVCHSSRQPERFWSDPGDWQGWLRDPDYLREASALARQEDFLAGNFLATDVRYSVADIGINVSRFLSDNARQDRVWQNFSSHDYKSQPVLTEELALAHPYDPAATFPYRFGERTGPGRVRPLTLTNLWSTAPYLHNNAVGGYPPGNDPGDYPAPQEADVSVAGRMAVFERSIEELLHLRERPGYDSIVRTALDTRFEVPRVVLIDLIRQQLGPQWVAILASALVVTAILGLVLIVVGLRRLPRGGIGRIFAALGVVLGLLMVVGSAELAFKAEHRAAHIPAGTPVNLLVNLNGPGWIANVDDPHLVRDIARDLGKVWLFGLPSLDHEDVPDLVDNLLALSKAPDLVIDRGHDFGGKDIHAADGSLVLPALSESQRRDLIEYLKTF